MTSSHLCAVLAFLIGAQVTLAQAPLASEATDKASEREQVGSSLGQPIYRDQIKGEPPTNSEVVQLFMGPVMAEFEQQHAAELEMSEDEIKAGVAWWTEKVRKRGGEELARWESRRANFQVEAEKRREEIVARVKDPKTPASEHGMLKALLRAMDLEQSYPGATEVSFMMRNFKLEQYLYDNYGGGRIILQQLGPEALDARRKLLLELEKAGKFQITSPELRKLAFDYWERPKHPGGFHTDRKELDFPWLR